MSQAETPTGAWAIDLAPRREQVVGTGLLAALACIVAMWTYIPVVHAGAWTLVTVTVFTVTIVSGMLTRSLLLRRTPPARAVITLLVQVVVVTLALTGMLLSPTALFGMIPTPATLDAFARLAGQAAAEVYNGTAPLADTAGLRAVLGAAFAVVSILLDHLVAQRLALFAAVLVTAVGALPMIITLGDANVVWFIVLAVLVLMLLRHSAKRDHRSSQHASLSVAAGVGVVAIALTVIVTPALPVSATWVAPGTGVTVDASLRLGDDLRRPNPLQVMTLATSAETAPYLRLATLSRFNGEIWRPDRSDTQPLADGFGDPEWNEEMAGTDRLTSIRVLAMSSSRLPVPYPAERIVGLPGDWEVMPANRTVVSEASDASGRDYTVTSARVQPTLEEISASDAGGVPEVDDELEELPEIIAETTRQVTAGAQNDYQRLIALQNWFRSEFEYSIDTPVEEDFDGTGADAVATFLDVRSGYCIHFAGAFALMAKTLDMPVRVVVGYLPGRLMEEKRGDEFLYAVMSDQLHSWPEVHFEGIGWVPFEPTATLGVPTAFAPGVTQGGAGGDGNAAPVPSAAPTAAATSGPNIEREDIPGAGAGTTSLDRLDPMPVLLVLGGTVVVLLMPLIVRSIRRAARMQRARGGDAGSAWEELRDTLVDLGLSPSETHTPRTRAAELISERQADPAALSALVSAIEQASYARTPASAGDLAEPLGRVIAQLRASVDTRARLAARFVPRSLFAQRPSPTYTLTA